MSILLRKSNNSIAAAKQLMDSNLEAPSVHCSYYSCIQLMLHIAIEKLGESSESLLSRSNFENTGSHVTLTNEIKKELTNRTTNYSELQTFSNNLATLKRNRTEADYMEIDITRPKCSASLDIAKKINAILERVFK